MQTLLSKRADTYEYCITKVTPHISEVHKFATPTTQKASKLLKPYIDQIAVITKPHVEKLCTVLKSYTNRMSRVSGIFLESATAYHHQVS